MISLDSYCCFVLTSSTRPGVLCEWLSANLGISESIDGFLSNMVRRSSGECLLSLGSFQFEKFTFLNFPPLLNWSFKHGLFWEFFMMATHNHNFPDQFCCTKGKCEVQECTPVASIFRKCKMIFNPGTFPGYMAMLNFLLGGEPSNINKCKFPWNALYELKSGVC